VTSPRMAPPRRFSTSTWCSRSPGQRGVAYSVLGGNHDVNSSTMAVLGLREGTWWHRAASTPASTPRCTSRAARPWTTLADHVAWHHPAGSALGPGRLRIRRLGQPGLLRLRQDRKSTSPGHRVMIA
jgi:hypothetical protein